MDMQWSNPKNNASFSKIPLIVCSLIMTIGTNPIFSATQEIPSALDVKSEEEAFLVRRIAEFWKDRDYVLVKRQINNFLDKFPSSPINNQLKGILGDLFLQEKKYDEAIKTYASIKDPAIVEKTIINRLQCYYELNDFATLLKEGKPYLTLNSKKLGDRKDELYFLIAESLFRISVESNDPSVKQDYAAQAKGLYEPLAEGPFAKHSKLALAEIYYTLKQYDKASSLYLELSNVYLDQKEELLNQAALSQAEFNPKAAIETFSKVAALKGKKANDAAINQLILLFQEEEFAEVLKNFKDVMPLAEADKKTTLEYIAGRSYFAMQDYKNASLHLEKYIALQQVPSMQLKNALLMQLNCAQKNNQDEVCDRAIALFKEHFSDDKEYGQALYIHAIMAKNRGDLVTAEEELATLVKLGTYDDKESLYLEYALITHENEKWEESYNAFKNFMMVYPTSQNRSVGVKYFLSTALNRLKTADSEDSSYSKTTFYDDMTFVLNEQSSKKNILSEDEEKDCRLLNAKTAYELKRYEVASKQFDTFIKDYPTDKNVGEAHFLVGICHQNLDADPELFYSNIEKAISYNPDLSKQSALHLQLYNAYLSKIDRLASAKNIPASQKMGLYDMAAEHLYQALTLGDTTIKMDNKLWLANHFYQKVKGNPSEISQTSGKRAFELYQTTILNNGSLITLNKENTLLEGEILKYSDLLSMKQDYKARVAILSNLAQQQNKLCDVSWNFPMQTLLELAQSYELLKDYDNALETYAFIISSNKGVPSYVVDYSTLHASRLNFMLLDKDQKNDQNEQVLAFLNQLKDIQIRKAPSSEPLHLESAITYARIRAEIAPEQEKDEKYLFFLGRIKEDYTSFEDPNVKDYHQKIANSAAKKSLYDSYMSYLDAEMLRTKAKMEAKNNQLSKAEELNSKALTLFSSIKSNPGLTAYLSENIHVSMKAIDQNN